ncbi:hypothetical protein CJU90_5238 [Yarrowia sp. C11]|nr:hypothetical protein CJU90_5238 [Yarrowia sp. C11]KAG5365035.1 hypothetical protein CKK34_3866 [Yarrowia sp. E02]
MEWPDLQEQFDIASVKAPWVVKVGKREITDEQFNHWLFSDHIYVGGCGGYVCRMLTDLEKLQKDPKWTNVESKYGPIVNDLHSLLSGCYIVVQNEMVKFEEIGEKRQIKMSELERLDPNPIAQHEKNLANSATLLSELKTLSSHGSEKIHPPVWEYIDFMMKTSENSKLDIRTLVAGMWVLEKVYKEAMFYISAERKKNINSPTAVPETIEGVGIDSMISWWAKPEFEQFVEQLGVLANKFNKVQFDGESTEHFEDVKKQTKAFAEQLLEMEKKFWPVLE